MQAHKNESYIITNKDINIKSNNKHISINLGKKVEQRHLKHVSKHTKHIIIKKTNKETLALNQVLIGVVMCIKLQH
jgi:uncharacterized protein (DUF2345 family)